MSRATTELTYHQLQMGRQECFQVWGDVQQLPIVESAYHRCRTLYAEIGGQVLDVGAGVNKPLQAVLGINPVDYWSLDDDLDGHFNFRKIEDIPADQYFNFIVANQLFEHLTIDESYAVMRGLADHLAPGGYLLVTVPNIAHPIRFRAVTHVTPWDYMSLYALYRLTGLRCVEIARYNKTPGPQTAEEKKLVEMLARLYRVDWCDSILTVGQKRAV